MGRSAQVAGAALLFYSYMPDGRKDERAYHAACPVVRGTKWIGQTWLAGGMTPGKKTPYADDL